ncbi:MAG: hypothetical protein EOS27_18705 [Mesorhizobium sp.]|nr:MAG: hypothetical protein EOS27_18705 [Mesorhizobium sp.]TIX22123.1 MAG: hypothetical protein E5V35_27010 [Mesorhizobium sp.]
MTFLDLGPPIPCKRRGAEPTDEQDHFYNCPNCGQLVDQRDARQVFYHEGPGQKPLEPEAVAKVVDFPRRK